eukprot:4156366-Prymnesium_polylepis.1
MLAEGRRERIDHQVAMALGEGGGGVARAATPPPERRRARWHRRHRLRLRARDGHPPAACRRVARRRVARRRRRELHGPFGKGGAEGGGERRTGPLDGTERQHVHPRRDRRHAPRRAQRCELSQ